MPSTLAKAALKDRTQCEKCGRLRKNSSDFFKDLHGNLYPVCRDCLTSGIDNRDPDTYTWVLKELDAPYIDTIWVKIANEEFVRNPKKFGPKSVLGKYLRRMRTAQFKGNYWADSEALSKKLGTTATKTAKEEAYVKKALERLEAGEITPSEYAAMTHTSVDDLPPLDLPAPAVDPEIANLVMDPEGENEKRILENISDEEYQYLVLKWGVNYKASQLVQMETMYEKYAAENDLNTDREETLKKICKTSLKMDAALDNDDYSSYASLSKVYDALRKSSKFTESQKQDKTARAVDSIGELVAFVEKESGVIPMHDSPIIYPMDKVDFIIKDMHTYVNKLVKDELGLGDLIESFINRQENSPVPTSLDLPPIDGDKPLTPVYTSSGDTITTSIDDVVRDVMPAPTSPPPDLTSSENLRGQAHMMMYDRPYYESEVGELHRQKAVREREEAMSNEPAESDIDS